MKGIIFTSFVAMLEEQHSPVTADAILQAAELPSRGAYTTVGYYDDAEMVTLTDVTCRMLDCSPERLHRRFGRYLAAELARYHPEVYATYHSVLDLVAALGEVIHPTVHKLYPGVRVPGFRVVSRDAGQVVTEYHSARGLLELAEGLIEGTASHYGERVAITREVLADDQTHARFTVRLTESASEPAGPGGADVTTEASS